MFHRLMKWTVPSLMGFALLISALAPTRARAEGCAEARAWVKQNARNLPTTYEAFIQQPMMYRRLMMEVMSPETKSALWRQHFVLYLEQHPSLTAEQKDVVHEAHYLASPENFRPEARESLKASLAALRQKGELVFDIKELSNLLTKLGSAEDSGMSLMRPSCDCSDDFDCGGGDCSSTICNTTDGCGTFGAYTCIGFCRY